MDRRLLILTDYPTEFDRRVLSVSALYPEYEITVKVVNERPGWVAWCLSWFIISLLLPISLLFYGYALKRIVRRHKLQRWPILDGFYPMVKINAKAIQFLWRYKSFFVGNNLLYANDQLCGVIAFWAKKIWGLRYVYDSHEMMPFRARKNGLLRMACESLLEKMIFLTADKSYVVNRPIQRFCKKFYRASFVDVRSNNFYPKVEIDIRTDGPRYLLYIGATNAHRGLSQLRELARMSDAELITVTADGGSELFLGGKNLKLAEYPDKLPSIINGSMSYMWCCFNSEILSYRYSLPNKFFQSLAYGIPMIVGRGTYLARLVNKYGIGLVFDESTASQIWDVQNYQKMRESVLRLRQRIDSGELVV